MASTRIIIEEEDYDTESLEIDILENGIECNINKLLGCQDKFPSISDYIYEQKCIGFVNISCSPNI